MFRKKKKEPIQKTVEPALAAEPVEAMGVAAAAEPIQHVPKSKRDLEDAAARLANSLLAYSDASYAARLAGPDEELDAVRRKVEAARKIVTEGRIAYALGRRLPEHIMHWNAWIARHDFMQWVSFDASNIKSSQTLEETNWRSIKGDHERFHLQ